MRNTADVIRKPPSVDEWDAVPCRQLDLELFYPEGKGKAAKEQAKSAIRVCGTCDLRDACLRMALSFESGDHWHRFGIFGGTTPDERAKLAKRTGTAA